MKFTEVELKYDADRLVSLTEFQKFCQGQTPISYIQASGYDYFYENDKDRDAFCRYRKGVDINQLTFKRKTNSNNFIRTEHNLDLLNVTREQVTALCSEFGYKATFTLFKTCHVYIYDWYSLVYYIVYDEDMHEKGRFVEIEMKEDYNWESEQQAWDQLVVLEKLCKPLGISPQSRVKRSLFEMFREAP